MSVKREISVRRLHMGCGEGLSTMLRQPLRPMFKARPGADPHARNKPGKDKR